MSSFQVVAATNRVDILDPALLRSGLALDDALYHALSFPLHSVKSTFFNPNDKNC